MLEVASCPGPASTLRAGLCDVNKGQEARGGNAELNGRFGAQVQLVLELWKL
jgi:hypothetical protein